MEINLESKWWKYLIFFLFALILILTVIHHEPWNDESRAWVIASDSTPLSLCAKYLRYDGHPPLWYLILMPAAKLGLPLITLNIISALIALFSLYLFLRYSPFPLIIKIIFPFSYFFLFQMTVVARSYVLIPPLLFLIAIIYEKKTEKIYYYVLLLCLLSLVSLHGFMIAVSLLVLHLIDLVRQWPSLSADTRKRQFAAYAIFAALVVFMVAQLFPPQDILTPHSIRFRITTIYRIAKWSLGYSMIGAGLWYLLVIIFGVSLVWFWRRKTLLLYVLPALSIFFILSISTIGGWHLSILFMLWIFCLWVSFGRYSGEREYVWKTWLSLRNAVLVCMIFVLGIQLIWSVEAVRLDLKAPYSATLEASEFIKKNHLEEKKIYYIGEVTISSILTYFDENIFQNPTIDGHRFDTYAAEYMYPVNVYANLNPSCIEAIEKEKPDYVIVAVNYHPDLESVLPGYELEKVFSGYNYNIMSLCIGNTDQLLLFERTKK